MKYINNIRTLGLAFVVSFLTISTEAQINDEHDSLLIRAVKNGSATVVSKMLKANININALDVDGLSALHWAILKQNNDVFSVLLSADDINVNIKEFENKDTPLIIASRFNNLEAVKLLIDHPNIDINLRNRIDRTALSEAVINENLDVVNILVEESNIDVTALDFMNDSLLTWASIKGYVFLVEVLLEKNIIDVNFQDVFDETALHFAAKYGHLDIVELLLQQPDIDVNSTDFSGYTPLMVAVANNKPETVKLLLNSPQIDTAIEGFMGKTALDLAQENKFQEIEKLLIIEDH